MDSVLNKYGAYVELKIAVPDEWVEKYATHIENHNQKVIESTNDERGFDDGFDLFTLEDIQLNSHMEKVNFGVKIQATHISQERQFPCGVRLYARSSIYKTPLRLANAVGVIDSGYRGDIIGMFDVLQIPSNHVVKGSRIVQLCPTSEIPFFVKLVNVDELSSTDRGSNGFGSSG